jgi:alpha-tubulin suppressor-like RCC1 family protein
VQVPGVERITLVAAGRHHSLAVAEDGRLWSWGDPDLLPKANTAWTPADWDRPAHIPRALEASVFGGSAVLSVTVGWAHLAAVTATGELWTWGVGIGGCKGIGMMTFAQSLSNVPRRVGTVQAGAEGVEAEGVEAGGTEGVGGAVAGAFAGASVYMADCGLYHTVVLTDSGVVWTCGSGTLGSLGHETAATCFVPTRIPQDCFGGHAIVSVAAAGNVSMAVTDTGALYSWGSGAVGHGNPDPHACVMRPTVVAETLPPGSRVARTCEIPPDSSVAFCMGAQARLGGDLCAYRSLPHELLERIVKSGRSLSGAFLHMGEGLLRMLAVRRRVA